MALEPSVPIFVWATGDLIAYPSRIDAERHLEAIDVKEGDLTGYDADGRLLKLTAVQKRAGALLGGSPVDVVSIECAENTPTHRSELRRILLKYLKASGVDEAESLQWEELVKMAFGQSNVQARVSKWVPKFMR